ncbi:FAD-binding oxidoreductase [Actinocrispum wychmicini]|uniref:Aclacinomycin oxidase n=1 Tax=Actinocrispum wychmicini TaxID=1213861 RepID=A0A4R2JW48_9PSEU|nr:FAD-binding oxidoreductase [Actinocrispum wychmicini]TCO64711.1 aclacinomycin oxidase [Actinocrispum wychmicini]
MTEHGKVSRRGVLIGAGAVAVGAAASGTAAASPSTGTAAVTIRPNDPRYSSLLRGNNFRFVGRPDEIRVVESSDQVARAVSDAVRSGWRVTPRSGGHCFENFTADPAVRMLLDLSPMNAVCYDPGMRAFAVQPGATLGHVYRTLFRGWGVTIPAGGCPEVGAGGHIAGGGYGPLSRRYGSVVDHLYAVEVVVVDRDGKVRVVVATREPNDPNRDLWWAHTGGGGGNFGVVTKYWLRSPDSTGTDPSRLLPAGPQEMRECLVVWSWDTMTESACVGLLRNFGTWLERNSAPGSRYAGLYPVFLPAHRSGGSFAMVVQADAGIPNVDDLITELVFAVTAGVDVKPLFSERRTLPWLHMVTWPGLGEPGDAITRRYKLKAGYLRRSLTDRQLTAIYRNLTTDDKLPNAGVLLIGYGGQVRTVPSGATATAQRDVVMKAVYQSIWMDETDDETNLRWVRNLYRDVYADTGGVPVPNEINDGSYINYPDSDLADPAWNTSGVPWHTLYYKDNYPRLQQVKARWDPRNVFRHALAIEPA